MSCSPRRLTGTLALACALAAALRGELAAQRPVARDCLPDEISALRAADIGAEWLAFHPDSAFDRMADALRANAWTSVLDTIAATFARMPGGDTTHRRVILAELGKLAPLFARAQSDPTARAREAAPAARWQLDGDDQEDATELFRADPAQRLRMTSAIPSDVRRNACWTVMLTLRVLNAYNAPGFERVVARLNQLAALWDTFASSGYSMLPWELFLNGRLSFRRPDLEPPRVQVVLLHPGAGVEVNGGKYPHWRSTNALPVELAGLLFYDGSRASYWGASVMAVATGDQRLGFGPLLHLGRVVKLGWAIRPRDAARRSASGALMSVDIFKFVTGVPGQLRAARDAALHRKTACLRPGGEGCP